jgi:DUF971 family protein
MNPKQIKIADKTKLLIKWNDYSESTINLKYLREECPCANCKGETILFKTFRPEKKMGETPEMFKIKNIETVGGYAIQVTWKDGHNTGIYSWDYLKKLEANQDNRSSENYTNLI